MSLRMRFVCRVSTRLGKHKSRVFVHRRCIHIHMRARARERRSNTSICEPYATGLTMPSLWAVTRSYFQAHWHYRRPPGAARRLKETRFSVCGDNGSLNNNRLLFYAGPVSMNNRDRSLSARYPPIILLEDRPMTICGGLSRMCMYTRQLLHRAKLIDYSLSHFLIIASWPRSRRQLYRVRYSKILVWTLFHSLRTI